MCALRRMQGRECTGKYRENRGFTLTFRMKTGITVHKGMSYDGVWTVTLYKKNRNCEF